MLRAVMREDAMRTSLVLSVAAVVLLSACGGEAPGPAGEQQAEAPAPAPAPEPQQGNTPPEDLDPFVVMIGAERWTVLLDRALEGSIQAPEPASAAEITDLYRADAAVKQGAAMVIQLRNRVCTKELVTGDACNLPEWPAWTRDMPTGDTPIEEIDRRSGWLDEVMAPFVQAGCEAGRAASADHMFCSVE
jgi:hypothetical protein